MDIVAELKNNGFCLGGSRRMAEKFPDLIKISEKTDWDFYGAYSADNEKILEQLSFVKVDAKDRTYWDSLLIDIWKQGNIEVLLRSDVKRYTEAFESISGETYYYRLWKSCPDVKTENPSAFRASICAYFCALFNQLKPSEEFSALSLDKDEIPF